MSDLSPSLSSPEGAAPAKATMPASTDQEGAAALMKWLIPSAAILFASAGYVVQAGQESLLGVGTSDRGSQAYINTAADFFRDSIVRLASWPITWPNHPMLHHPLLLSFALIVVGGAISALFSTRLHKRFSCSTIVSAAAGAIALVVVVKFLALDAPLLRIQDLVSSGNSCWSLAVQQGQKPTDCAQAVEATGVDRWVWQEAGEVAGEIVCSRVTKDTAARLRPLIAKSSACNLEVSAGVGKSAFLNANKESLADEFLCNLLLEILTIAGAIALLRHAANNRGAVAIGLLTAFYGVSAPYAYGKVGVTPVFEFGQARISGDLQASYQAENNSIVHQPYSQTATAGSPKDPPHYGWIRGALLRTDQGGISLLTIRSVPCPAHGGVIPSQDRASLSFIAQSQLLSFDEISKDDLITWLVESQSDCP